MLYGKFSEISKEGFLGSDIIYKRPKYCSNTKHLRKRKHLFPLKCHQDQQVVRGQSRKMGTGKSWCSSPPIQRCFHIDDISIKTTLKRKKYTGSPLEVNGWRRKVPSIFRFGVLGRSDWDKSVHRLHYFLQPHKHLQTHWRRSAELSNPGDQEKYTKRERWGPGQGQQRGRQTQTERKRGKVLFLSVLFSWANILSLSGSKNEF